MVFPVCGDVRRCTILRAETLKVKPKLPLKVLAVCSLLEYTAS
jgi:hypothetical protein